MQKATQFQAEEKKTGFNVNKLQAAACMAASAAVSLGLIAWIANAFF
jgi:hypothetical protein